MNKVLRVFLKGEPNRWIDFPYPPGATFFGLLGQGKFEGWIIRDDRMVAYDSIAAAVEITNGTAPISFGTMPAAGNA